MVPLLPVLRLVVWLRRAVHEGLMRVQLTEIGSLVPRWLLAERHLVLMLYLLRLDDAAVDVPALLKLVLVLANGRVGLLVRVDFLLDASEWGTLPIPVLDLRQSLLLGRHLVRQVLLLVDRV